MNGGAWVMVGGQRVDIIYRDLDVVEYWMAEAQHGRFKVERLPFYLAGIPTYVLVGELALCRVLVGQLPRPGFPPALQKTAPPWWDDAARLSLEYAEHYYVPRGDAIGCAGSLARAVMEASHGQLATQGVWVLNEKRLVERAGFAGLQHHFEHLGSTPDELQTGATERSGGHTRVIEDSLNLPTPRLTLVPFSADLLRLTLTDREALESSLTARFLPQWHTEPQLRVLNGVLQALEADPESRVWRFYFILHITDRAVIGDAGFKGPPDREGSVEIAYGVVPAYRRQGYAFEAVQALVRWAFTHPEVRVVTAVCDDDNTGSIRILEKLRMQRVGVEDRSLLWRLPRSSD